MAVTSTKRTFAVTEIAVDEQYSCKLVKMPNTGVYNIYCDYAKGSEDGVVLEFKVYEKALDTHAYLQTLDMGNVSRRYQIKFLDSDVKVIPVALPVSADEFYCVITFIGDLSSVGSLNIEARIEKEKA